MLISMSDSKISSTLKEKAEKLLKSVWDEIARIPAADLEKTTFIDDPELKDAIRDLVNASTKAFRYAVLNQILAKAAQHDLNCLALQKSAGLSGSFDARSLCKQVVVPFENDHLGGCLGKSTDPYVSKPLRREHVSLEEKVIKQIKNKAEWEKLYKLLSTVENRNDPALTEQVLKQILLEMRKLSSRQPLSLPSSISAEEIRTILVEYIAQAKLGLGPQAVAYSLLEIFNKRTKTYHTVTSVSPTTADTFTGRVADIECRDEKGSLRLAVCVTQKLNLQKLENELVKCSRSGVKNALFLAYEIAVDRQEAYKKASNYDINAAICDLVDFVLTITALLNNEMRKELIARINAVLQEWGGAGAAREFTETVAEVLKRMQQRSP